MAVSRPTRQPAANFQTKEHCISVGQPMSGSDPTAEVVASQLAQSWTHAWRFYAGDSRDPVVRMEALVRARALLSFTIKTAGCMISADKTAAALLVIQGFGDGYALMSEAWPIDGQLDPTMPVRSWVTWYIRESGLDVWCADIGHPILIDDAPDYIGMDPRKIESDLLLPSGLNLATALASEAKMYKRLVGSLETSEGRLKYTGQAESIRRIACRSLSEYRRASYRYQREAADERLTIDALSVLIIHAELRFLVGAYATAGDIDTFQPVDIEILQEMYVITGVDGWVRDFGLDL
jgi:hypothetical protein